MTRTTPALRLAGPAQDRHPATASAHTWPTADMEAAATGIASLARR